MSDAKLRELEREYHDNPTIANGRRLYCYLFRLGHDDQAKTLRDSLSYVDMAKGLPRPTEDQCRAFTEYVANAHSWYKHLHPKIPSRFYVYLDPGAMMFDDGRMVQREDCWHYSSIPTLEYRQKYSYWVYYLAGGTEPELGDAPELITTLEPKHEVPAELRVYALCTAHVHASKFEKAIAPPRKGSEYCTEEFEQYNQETRDSFAKGKLELRSLYQATQSFLKKLDELYGS